MAKPATAKDVVYALQFNGARLIMRPATVAGRSISWVIEPGGIKVPAREVDEARRLGSIVCIGGRDGESDLYLGSSSMISHPYIGKNLPEDARTVPEGFRPASFHNAGPVEAAMLSHVAAVRARLRGRPPEPVVVRMAPAVEVEEAPPPPKPSGLVTSKGRAIVVAVAHAHGLNWRELISPNRTQRIVAARNEASFRLVTELNMSNPQAGRVLGGRDHATILHACRRYATSSPEAAEIWRKHVECETSGRMLKRAQALRLHAQGLTVGEISGRVHAMPVAVAGWIEKARARVSA